MFGAIVGTVMLVVGLALIIPELALDSPADLLWSLLGSRNNNLFALIDIHIRARWPDTKLAAILFYGGLFFLVVSGIGFWRSASSS